MTLNMALSKNKESLIYIMYTLCTHGSTRMNYAYRKKYKI